MQFSWILTREFQKLGQRLPSFGFRNGNYGWVHINERNELIIRGYRRGRHSVLGCHEPGRKNAERVPVWSCFRDFFCTQNAACSRLVNDNNGLTELTLAIAMILVLVLRPGGLFPTREIGHYLFPARRDP